MDNLNHCSVSRTPYLCFDQGSKAAVFVHGNGLPPGCYRELLQQLDDYRVTAPFLRPCQPGQSTNSPATWPELTAELLAFLDAQYDNQHCVAISHSTGAIPLLMAALQAPQRFEKLVFIEPTFLPWHWVLLSQYLPRQLREQWPVLKRLHQQRQLWPCLQAVFDDYRPRRAFRLLSDPALWQVVRGCCYQSDQGWRLRYPKQQEAYYFQRVPQTWHLLRQLEVPILAIRAGLSPYLTRTSWEKWRKMQPDTQFAEFNRQDHLLPLALPQEVADTMLEFFDS